MPYEIALEIDLEQIQNPIEIKKNKIPLIISNYYKNIFEKIYIENIDKDFISILKTMARNFSTRNLLSYLTINWFPIYTLTPIRRLPLQVRPLTRATFQRKVR